MKQKHNEYFNSLCADLLRAYNALQNLRKQLQTDNRKILSDAICALVEIQKPDCDNFLASVEEFEAEAERKLDPKQPRDIKALACFYLARNVDSANQNTAKKIARDQIAQKKQTDYFNS